jgi:hypothetical protein
MRRTPYLRRHGIGLGALVAMTLCLGLLFAAPASAKSVQYWAPLARSDGENSWIEFKVVFRRSQRTGKFRPVEVKKFGIFWLLSNCTDGDQSQVPGFNYPDRIPVKRRKFSVSDTRGDTTFETSGFIPRKGRIKGSVRLAYESGDPAGGVHCNSGSLSWTARRLPY